MKGTLSISSLACTQICGKSVISSMTDLTTVHAELHNQQSLTKSLYLLISTLPASFQGVMLIYCISQSHFSSAPFSSWNTPKAIASINQMYHLIKRVCKGDLLLPWPTQTRSRPTRALLNCNAPSLFLPSSSTTQLGGSSHTPILFVSCMSFLHRQTLLKFTIPNQHSNCTIVNVSYSVW